MHTYNIFCARGFPYGEKAPRYGEMLRFEEKALQPRTDKVYLFLWNLNTYTTSGMSAGR